MRKLNQRFHAHVLRRERERKGESRLLTLHYLELHIRAPGCGFAEGHSGLRSVTGKNGWLPLKNREPGAEGSET